MDANVVRQRIYKNQPKILQLSFNNLVHNQLQVFLLYYNSAKTSDGWSNTEALGHETLCWPTILIEEPEVDPKLLDNPR